MKRTIFFLLAFLLPLILIGQEADPSDLVPIAPKLGPGAVLQDFMTLYDGLYAAVFVILGYLHNWIPGLNFINSKWLRIVLIGAVVAVIFVALGFTNGLSTMFVFLQAVGFYSLILKKVSPSPTVTPKAETPTP